MDLTPTAPFLPESAPFSEEQRTWFNRLFADVAAGRMGPAGASAGGSALGASATGSGHEALRPSRLAVAGDGHVLEPVVALADPIWSKTSPFHARVLARRRLNSHGSAKETCHIEFSLAGSGLTYESGDALGVLPCNCPETVDVLLDTLGFTGDEPVHLRDETERPVREALLYCSDLVRLPPALLEVLADGAHDEELANMLASGRHAELIRFVGDRDLLDVLRDYPSVQWTPADIVSKLRPLQPRLYSISSSPKAHAGQVHLTVGVVRYRLNDRVRNGVCSTFLADRVGPGASVPIYVHRNANFRLPEDPSVPVIMIGPGTGIAPFRSFLHERSSVGAAGRAWLFFGDQHVSADFLYREELEALQRDGALTRLDTAFSRDQAEKVYVQHRMVEHSTEFFAWLEEGAHVYVCGDAHRMARDVDAALHRLIEKASGIDPDRSAEYVRELKKAGRYSRDVY